MDDLERCTRCTVPITWETVRYDENGVCNICRNWETKQRDIDWEARERQLRGIFDEAKRRGGEYDCIVPFSGGKDSTYTLWAIVRQYGLRPLVVSFDHGFYRPRMIENRTRTFRRLGVDVLSFTPNWRVVRKLMREALIRRGDFCWHCHAGVFAYPMRVAVRYRVPLLIWGEGGGEYEAYFKFADLEETRTSGSSTAGSSWECGRRTWRASSARIPGSSLPLSIRPGRSWRRRGSGAFPWASTIPGTCGNT